ncbi:calcium/sodium antiporter [Chloroflexus aggregans]|uniref:Na+/Ca+ antiporter, CaCA family n=1 Tax=Chloroflexus aggregans (strain MD-66 / DSM 9485) TaxID=326427 RepID=B8G9Y8_CHLAD|nr:calcium/sodium antiporter [Chloroflexus aggregans]ACL24503.1 Na+/Ca+ antiporter, CaCA family [Chloroflexus aggregans DSM 9485]
MTVILFLVGVVLLVFGADLLVRGAASLAASMGVSSLIIGLTVVAVGTSSPEIAVSLQAAFQGQGAITLGNIVGSNIANVMLILGVAAMFGPLPVDRQIFRRDLPVMIGASLLTLLLAFDRELSRVDGVIMLLGLLGYIWAIWPREETQQTSVSHHHHQQHWRGVVLQLAMVVGGLALLVLGANWLVDGAVAFASWFGVSELIIGLTIVAVGTSLPEIATSVIAGLRGERDIAVGNVIGSNILNLLLVLALTIVLSPQPIAVPVETVQLDLPVMVGAALVCLPIFFTRRMVSQREGSLLLVYYLSYTLYLILSASQNDELPLYNTVVGLVLVPLTVVLLVVRALRWLGEERRLRQMTDVAE